MGTVTLDTSGRIKARVLRLVPIGAFLIGSAALLPAVGIQIQGHISIAPISIPIGESGATGIGMARLQARNGDSGDSDTSLSEITVQATSGGAFDFSKISDIRVYFEPGGMAADVLGEYDNGAALNDVRVDTGGPYTFSTNPVTVQLNPTLNTLNWGASEFFYVVFAIASDADTTTTLGCEITQVEYGAAGTGTGSFSSPGPHNTRKPVDRHRVTATAAGTAAASYPANETGAQVLRLDLALADASASVQLSAVKVHRLGGSDNWVSGNGVLLYADDGDDVFEPGADDGATVATGTLGLVTAGYATLNLASSAAVPAAGKSFWVAVNMNSLSAVPGQTFGLEVESPATDITFVDEIEDDTTNSLDPEYAYVTYFATGLYEYDQTGYVNPASTTAIPAAGNTFTVEPPDDGVAPDVATKFPAAGATNVDLATDITVVFTEWMQESGGGSVTNVANYEFYETLTPTNTVSFTLDYADSTQTLTVDPDTVLDWGTQYTFTIKYTVEDYYGNPLGTSSADDYSWTFTVEPETVPYISNQSPGIDDANVPVNTTIEILFSEDMNTGSFAGKVTLQDGDLNNVSGEITASGPRTLVFTPGTVLSPVGLEYGEEYTVTVLTGITDAEGSAFPGTSWTFTTILQFPVFDEPIAINNRIVPGGNDEVLVFVAEPPRGPSDRVSVQVYTTSGRRVATLVNNRPYSEIAYPIYWYGRNDGGKDLGPGLYFVQIRATNYKRVLKVMIVR